jgi:hypothetical protein
MRRQKKLAQDVPVVCNVHQPGKGERHEKGRAEQREQHACSLRP